MTRIIIAPTIAAAIIIMLTLVYLSEQNARNAPSDWPERSEE